MAGFEPATPGFLDRCSTFELHSNPRHDGSDAVRGTHARKPCQGAACAAGHVMTKIGIKQKTPETSVSGVACVPNTFGTHPGDSHDRPSRLAGLPAQSMAANCGMLPRIVATTNATRPR